MNSVRDLIMSLASAPRYPCVRRSDSVLVITVHIGTGMFEREMDLRRLSVGVRDICL